MFGRGSSSPEQARLHAEDPSPEQSRLRGNGTPPTARKRVQSSSNPASGKGRPTPKRSEAEKGRRRVAAAPLDRKEAFKRNRERQREVRQRAMQALKAGDERHLPMRDRGPVRRYVRDAVDARRSVGEFFLPVALLILILTSLRNAQLAALGSALWILLVVLVIVDAVALVFRVRRSLARALPDENHKGAVAYALMRSMQIRRFRLPPPRVKPGGRRRASMGRSDAGRTDRVKPDETTARSARSSRDH